jgi:hypothetical protein
LIFGSFSFSSSLVKTMHIPLHVSYSPQRIFPPTDSK